MKKKEEFLSKKKSRYSIRKFTVGTASILVGATLIYGSGEAQAAESEGTVTEQSTTERVDDYKDINQSLSETEKKLKQTSSDQEKTQVLAEFLSKDTDASFEEATDKANSLNIDFNDVNSNPY